MFAAVHQHSGHSDGRRRGLRPEPHLLGDDHHSLPGVLARSLRVQLLPCRGLRRRHLHVLRRCHVRSRNGERVCLREGGHLRSLQQVAPPLLHSSTGELLAFASAAVRFDSLSSSPTAQVGEGKRVNGRINAETGLLQPSLISEDEKSPYYGRINHTLINVFLYWFGPMSEQHLTRCLLGLQAGCSLLAVVIRYTCGGLFRVSE